MIRGRERRVTTQESIESMVAARQNTRLAVLDAGHVVYLDNAIGFSAEVRRFLDEVA